MQINELFKNNRPVISFEVFPPKNDTGIATIYETIDQLIPLKPDYISVTYGAGGSLTNRKTIEIASYIKNRWGVESVAHLTCITSSKAVIEQILADLDGENIENILALRGDIPASETLESLDGRDFTYAVDLIEHLQGAHNFAIGGACYPEGHIETRDVELELQHLKKKVTAGATFLITQLFFDNADFYDFVRRAREEGIDVPIQAGIMPVLNKRQIKRITELCGARIPEDLNELMNRYEFETELLVEAGIEYAAKQIIGLLESGVDGIHIYTMNNAQVAKGIMARIEPFIVGKTK